MMDTNFLLILLLGVLCAYFFWSMRRIRNNAPALPAEVVAPAQDNLEMMLSLNEVTMEFQAAVEAVEARIAAREAALETKLEELQHTAAMRALTPAEIARAQAPAVEPAAGRKTLDESLVAAYRARLEAQGYAPATIQNKLRAVDAFVDWLAAPEVEPPAPVATAAPARSLDPAPLESASPAARYQQVVALAEQGMPPAQIAASLQLEREAVRLMLARQGVATQSGRLAFTGGD